jgi:hypothetical protein
LAAAQDFESFHTGSVFKVFARTDPFRLAGSTQAAQLGLKSERLWQCLHACYRLEATLLGSAEVLAASAGRIAFILAKVRQ